MFVFVFCFLVEKLPLGKKKWTSDSIDSQWTEKVKKQKETEMEN